MVLDKARHEPFRLDNLMFDRIGLASSYDCMYNLFDNHETDIWLIYYLITDGVGDSCYDGNVVGAVILDDLDKDGRIESLTLVWTAFAARRKGVARALVAHARQHFALKRVGGLITPDGMELLRAVWPESLEPGNED
jgi:hypothetical protein